MDASRRNTFPEKVKLWSNNAATSEFPDWEDQIRLLSEMSDLITPDLAIEEVISVIYASVNQIMDAYQFAVGLYNVENQTILIKGMIENSLSHPDVLIDALQEDRFAPWCIQNESEIFINDMDVEYIRYVKTIPYPYVGSSPKAALYVPLFMNDIIAGFITVRTLNKNVYHQHHLYLLKTLGNFVMKSLALSHERERVSVISGPRKNNYQWSDVEQLSNQSKKMQSLLTDREKEVLMLLVSGLSNKAIAERLFISPSTIKTHTLNLYSKMEVGNR